MERKEFIQLVGKGAATALIMPCLIQCTEDEENPKPKDTTNSNDDNTTATNGSNIEENDDTEDTSDNENTVNRSHETESVDFTIDITKEKWSDLQEVGGFVYTNGIIIAHAKDNSFLAVSKKCTHADFFVEYEKDKERFYCPTHGSAFNEDGTVDEGPALTALKEYETSFNSENNTIRVFERTVTSVD